MFPSKPKDLLDSYLRGKTTAFEDDLVNNWYERLEEEPASYSYVPEENLRLEIWDSLRSSIKKGNIFNLETRAWPLKNLLVSWLQIAGAVLFAFAGGILMLVITSRHSKTYKSTGHPFLTTQPHSKS